MIDRDPSLGALHPHQRKSRLTDYPKRRVFTCLFLLRMWGMISGDDVDDVSVYTSPNLFEVLLGSQRRLHNAIRTKLWQIILCENAVMRTGFSGGGPHAA